MVGLGAGSDARFWRVSWLRRGSRVSRARRGWHRSKSNKDRDTLRCTVLEHGKGKEDRAQRETSRSKASYARKEGKSYLTP